MEVIDMEHWRWILLRDGGHFYLDVVCSHSACDYPFLMKLNEEEVRQFEERGRGFLHELAHQVHYSAPGVKGNRSPFKGRDVHRILGGRVTEAAVAFRERAANQSIEPQE
jgi:hypothetical protein